MSLQIRRGLDANRTFVAAEGEPLWVTDTDRLYVGDGETTGGKAVKALPVGTAGGDLSGSFPNPGVAKVQGNAVESGTPANNEALVYSTANARWEHKLLGLNGTAVSSTAPNNNQTLIYNTSTSQWAPGDCRVGQYSVQSVAPANNDGLVYSTANSRWEPKHPVLTSTESFITADVGLQFSTWVTVTSVSLAAGTWLVTGNLTASGTMDYNAGMIRLYDGTNTVASGAFTGIIDWVCGTHITAIVTLTATTTISLEGYAHDLGMTAVRRVNPGILKATGINAVRIA